MYVSALNYFSMNLFWREVKKLNKKIVICVISILSLSMILSAGLAFAAQPSDVEMVMFLNAEIVSNEPVGKNVFSDREIVGAFTSGPVVGDVEREISTVTHYTGKITVQNIVYVENAIIALDGAVAEGSFVMKIMGMVGNAKWVIIGSDLTVDAKPVNLQGQGTATVTAFIPVDATHYNLENTLIGQLNLTP
jgi:hypothetical protein